MPVLIDLRCEHYHAPIGISHPTPRLSWRFQGSESERNWIQKAYNIRLHRDEGDTEVYRVETSQSVLVPWPGSPLQSRDRVRVEVSVEGSDGQTTPWAEIQVEAGLFVRDDWIARMVTSTHRDPLDGPKRPFRARRGFDCPSNFSRARLYITSHGIHEAFMNGVKIGTELLAPGWTDYRHRLRYSVHDIGHLLVPGQVNTLGAWLGEGWYCGRLGFRDGVRNVYGDRMGLLAQLEIDGQVVFQTDTDSAWEWSFGNIVASELMDGEVFDSTISDDWICSDGWKPVELASEPFPQALLVTSESPPVRPLERFVATTRIITPTGKVVLDFGQNFAGFVEIVGEPKVKHGEVTLRYAEVLENGELGTRPLRAAKATDRIMLGGPIAGYRARFTNHGFRYVQVDGWPDVTIDDFVGVQISSDMSTLGTFECSHALLSHLHKNVVYSTRSNTISIPTDCPQRDERLGWTGDIAVFAPTLNYLFDGAGFLGDWLKDLRFAQENQKRRGVVPVIIPELPLEALSSFNQAIWGDSVITIPWDMYQASGDKQVLRDSFQAMRLWLDEGVLRDPETGLWARENKQLGDWLDPNAPPHLPGRGKTDPILVSDAYLVYSTRLLARIADVLGETSASDRYWLESARLLSEFHSTYVTSRSRVMSDSQTALALLLHFDLVDPQETRQRQVWSQRLEELVIKDFWQVSTGFAGTPIILHTLAANNMLHHAYRMLLARDCPSWLSPVLLGATTIWERWDSMLADGSINPGNMTSFNHYALGAVADFLHRVVGGLAPLEPGWKSAMVEPGPGGNLTWAKTSHESVYGRVECRWEIVGDELRVDVTVPPNTTARVKLPGGTVDEEVGSGRYHYTVPYTADERFPPVLVQPEFCRPVDKDWVR